MKHKIWLYQIPIVALFCGLYAVGELATDGKLDHPLLRKAYPLVRFIDGVTTDLKFKLRGPIPSGNPVAPVAVVEIDDDSIQAFGRWPWHRDTSAKLIQKIHEAGAIAIGLDIVFAEPDQRVSPEIREILLKQKINPEQYETDNQLNDLLLEVGTKTSLGYSVELCQPRYSDPGECEPLRLKQDDGIPGQESLSDSYQRFQTLFSGAIEKIDWKKTPLFVARGLVSNHPIFHRNAFHSGNFNGQQDPDGVIRRVPLIYYLDNAFQPSLALSLAKIALGSKHPNVRIGEDGLVDRIEFEGTGIVLPVSKMGVLDLNFRGDQSSFPVTPAYLLLQDREPILASLAAKNPEDKLMKDEDAKELLESMDEAIQRVKGKLVLVGVSASGAFDLRSFPYGATIPGVFGHATALDNILKGDALIRAASGPGRVILFLLMSLGALLLAYGIERLQAVSSILLFMAVFLGLGAIDVHYLFTRKNLNLNTGLIALELLFVFVITLAVKYITEEKNKKFIKLAFSKYVSPSIVDSILKDPSKLQVGGEKRDLSILFSDIRSFTTFSEKMDAKQLSNFLNNYLGLMTDVVFEQDGTLDKYIGDAVMAFWGAPVLIPKHASLACQAAIQMQQIIRDNQPRWKSEYGIDVQVGVGINSGSVSVGNMGSERIFEYTVIGDQVNLASRIEGLTKHYGVKILTTRFTFDEIEKSGEPLPPHRVLDFVKVKGKKQAIELIQLLELPLPAESHEFFAKGRACYSACQWDDATACFMAADEIHEKAFGEPDGAARMFIERIAELKATPPPADWGGAYEMTSK